MINLHKHTEDCVRKSFLSLYGLLFKEFWSMSVMQPVRCHHLPLKHSTSLWGVKEIELVRWEYYAIKLCPHNTLILFASMDYSPVLCKDGHQERKVAWDALWRWLLLREQTIWRQLELTGLSQLTELWWNQFSHPLCIWSSWERGPYQVSSLWQ